MSNLDKNRITEAQRRSGEQLREAAGQGRIEDVRRLLDQGVDVDAWDVTEATPLIRAA